MFKGTKYYISQAFSGVAKNKLMVFISLSTVTFSLLLLGLAVMFGTNLEYISKQLEAQFELHAFVKLDYNEQSAKSLEPKIKQIPGIKTLVFSTKEEALKSLGAMFDDSDALAGLEEDNPLEYSYKITLTDISMAQSVDNELKKIEGISSVSNRTDILNGITTFTIVARNTGIIGMLIFAFIAVFIISNTIKLALMSRKKEISIMKSVGATNGFIRGPFIIEGILVGLAGGIIACIPSYFGYRSISHWWQSSFFCIFKLLPLSELALTLVTIFLLVGGIIGAIGSIMSVRKYLKA